MSRASHQTIDSNVNSSPANKQFRHLTYNYCNSLLAGLLAYHLERVQSILNFAALLIYERAKNDHVAPVLWNKLHWLRVP